MKLREIQFCDYGLLTESEQEDYTAALKYAKPYEIDIKQWKYGVIKECQMFLERGVSEEGFDFIVKQVMPYYLYKPYHLVMLTFLGICKSIKELTDSENNALISKMSGKEQAALAEVNFEELSRYPEIINLAETMGISFDEAYNVEWATAFIILRYKNKQYQFQQIISKA